MSPRQARFAGFFAGAIGTIVVGLFLTVVITGQAIGTGPEPKLRVDFID
ncbi:hypothetical protein AAD018_010565 [Aestuariibius insulae]